MHGVPSTNYRILAGPVTGVRHDCRTQVTKLGRAHWEGFGFLEPIVNCAKPH